MDNNRLCIVCNKQSGIEKLFKVVSSNFTAYELLYKNKKELVCQDCIDILKNPKMRRSSWIQDKKQTIFFKNNESLQYILNLSNYIEIPFRIGFTKSFKKHTFLQSVWNYDYNNFKIGTDFAGTIEFDKNSLINCIYLLQFLYRLGFSKEDLKNLSPSLHRFNQFQNKNMKKLWYKKYRPYLKKYNNNPVYDMIIIMLKRDEEELKNARKQRKHASTVASGYLFSVPERS